MTHVYPFPGASKTAKNILTGKIILFSIKYPTKFVGYYKLLCSSILSTGYLFVYAAPAVVCRRASYNSLPRMGAGPYIVRF
jgi:hypothetical protein